MLCLRCSINKTLSIAVNVSKAENMTFNLIDLTIKTAILA